MQLPRPSQHPDSLGLRGQHTFLKLVRLGLRPDVLSAVGYGSALVVHPQDLRPRTPLWTTGQPPPGQLSGRWGSKNHVSPPGF